MTVLSMPNGNESQGPRSVHRAMLVLRAFTSSVNELSLSQIAMRCDLAPSTAHRLCRALVGGGFLVQDTRTGRYSLGPSALAVGQSAEASLGIDRAREILARLPGARLETVKLGIAWGTSVSILFRVWVHQRLHFDRPSGSPSFPMHASAMGKVLLAYRPDRDRFVSTLAPLPRFSSRTITDVAALRDELDQIRLRGFATGDEEWKPGVTCVAAPLLNPSGTATAAIAAGLPPRGSRSTPVEAYGPTVVRIAQKLTDVFSSRSWPALAPDLAG